MARLLILLLAAVTCCYAQDLWCGTFPVPPPPSHVQGSKIMNGTTVIQGQFPWILSLQSEQGSVWSHFCGGTLLSANWAITSARCVSNLDSSGTYRIAAGEHNLTEDSGFEQYSSFSINDVTIHPNFTEFLFPYENDVALIAIRTPIDLNATYVGAACLPPNPQRIYEENPHCFISGWGESYDGVMQTVVHHASAEVMRPLQCSLEDFPGILNILDSNLCIYDPFQYNRGPCYGDEGGPLHCMIDAHFELAGIISSFPVDCSEEQPALLQRTTYFLNWITQTTGVPPRPPA